MMIFNSAAVYLGASLLAPKNAVGVLLRIHTKARFARASRSPREFMRVSSPASSRDVLSRADFAYRARRADCLHGETVGQRDVMTYLVELWLRKRRPGVDTVPLKFTIFRPR
jgi:hypothetical protein